MTNERPERMSHRGSSRTGGDAPGGGSTEGRGAESFVTRVAGREARVRPGAPYDPAAQPNLREKCGLDRRAFIARMTALGVAGAVAEQVWAEATARGPITPATLAEAARLARVELSESERALMVAGVEELGGRIEQLRKVPLPNSVAPALRFSPLLPGMTVSAGRRGVSPSRVGALTRPSNIEQLAFAPIPGLAELLRTRQVRSIELTEMYLDRLRRFDDQLNCVVTFCEKRALEQARRADDAIAAGRYRGPLHGIPWGAKDLLAVRGYPTTWGAAPYASQVIDEDATVVRRLDEAGAVLVAKLTLGELATGDLWFGGQTCSPWDVRDGSSGSSAGAAAAVAAGLVGFAIGSETRGSILSPCTRCGATGLRPTFGLVSRHGAMALAWSMDKLGPICRAVEDCALVLAAIAGPDGRDETVLDVPCGWDATRDVRSLRVGYLRSAFEKDAGPEDPEGWVHDQATLEAVRALGVDLVPIELPELPVDALSFILHAEAAAAFDELSRGRGDDMLMRQDAYGWPNRLRVGRTVPAVDYLQANRVRRLAMQEMARILSDLDVYLSPTFASGNILLTNLTGHPAVVLPNGFRRNGTPTSVTFIGNLFRDAEAMLLAKAYQDATGFHLLRPPRFV